MVVLRYFSTVALVLSFLWPSFVAGADVDALKVVYAAPATRSA